MRKNHYSTGGGFFFWFYKKNRQYTDGFLAVFYSLQAVFGDYARDGVVVIEEWSLVTYWELSHCLIRMGLSLSESSTLHRISMIISGCMSDNTLALFSPLLRIPTLSRLSQSFLCSDVVMPNFSLAGITARHSVSSRNVIKSSSGTLSNFASIVSLCAQSVKTTCGLLSQSRRDHLTISSRNMVTVNMRSSFGRA